MTLLPGSLQEVALRVGDLLKSPRGVANALMRSAQFKMRIKDADIYHLQKRQYRIRGTRSQIELSLLVPCYCPITYSDQSLNLAKTVRMLKSPPVPSRPPPQGTHYLP
jgi:hypothetical protein